MFGIPKAQPHPLSLGVGAPPSHPSTFDGGLPQAPGLIPSQQSAMFVSPFPPPPPLMHPHSHPHPDQHLLSQPPPSNHPRPTNPVRRHPQSEPSEPSSLTVNNSGTVRNQGSSRQSATRLRPEAPVFLPKKEESDFMRATEASMAKVRRVASSTNVAGKEAGRVTTNTDVRSSNEGRRSSGGIGSTLTNSKEGPTAAVGAAPTKGKRESHPGGAFSLPPPASGEEKDEWEEKVKAEMQA
eukprot:gene14600-10439_t